jgi:tetratricopeptide (TPR) repeat protein
MKQEVDARVREQFDGAIKLQRAGQFREAIEHLEGLLRDGVEPSNVRAAVNGQIGGIYLYDLNRPDIAEKYYREATTLHHFAERATMGLFHTLMNLRKVFEAIDEMQRYLLHTPASKPYAFVLDEMRAALERLHRTPHHRLAVESAPPAEQDSLRSFHALIGERRVMDALNEMKRFLEANQASTAYCDILDEIAEAGDNHIIKLHPEG